VLSRERLLVREHGEDLFDAVVAAIGLASQYCALA
jgi:hypothetical protein